MTLHEAMIFILQKNNGPMTPRQLSDAINAAKLYTRNDGRPVPPNQIGARAKNYPQLFEKKDIDGRVHFLLRK